MLQRHLDNRSIPVWSKVIPQSRGSHQQPAALSTFSRRRVVQLSGELVCSFKSVQCSTSSSKIGHLISLVAFQLQRLHFNCTGCISIAPFAFQLHWLHFNYTGCTSSGSRFLQDGEQGSRTWGLLCLQGSLFFVILQGSLFFVVLCLSCGQHRWGKWSR